MSAEDGKKFGSHDIPSTPEGEQKGPVITWLEERIKSATIQVDKIPLGEVCNWGMVNNDLGTPEMFANIDPQGNPRFFTFEGRRIWTSGREVASFDQPAIIEVPDIKDPKKTSGVVGLFVDSNSGDILVQAAAEPMAAEPGAEPGAYLTLRTAVQGSFTNISTNKVNFADRVDLNTYNYIVPVNAGRIYGIVRVGVTQVNKNDINISDKPNFKWFSTKDIDNAIVQGAPFNDFFHTAYDIHNVHQRIRGRAPR